MDIVAYLVKQKVDSLNQENIRLKEEHSRLLFFNREMAEENTRLKELTREMVEALKRIANHRGVAMFEDDGTTSYCPVMPKEIQVIAKQVLAKAEGVE